jgi:hypothetical protein
LRPSSAGNYSRTSCSEPLKEDPREGARAVPLGKYVLGLPGGDLAGHRPKALLSKLIADKGVDDLLLTLADVLKDHLRTGVNENVVREQLSLYSES